MFFHFLSRELRRALSQPMVYIFTLIFGLLVFGAVASDSVVIGGAVGMVHKNSPDVLTGFVAILSLFGLLFATAFCNNAAIRDYRYQFDEIVFSTPVSKFGMFFGRFVGAFLLSCIPFLGVFLGAWLAGIIAPAVGWLSPDRIGPLHFHTVVSEFLIFILPNMLFGCAIIFLLAHRFKNIVVSFVGAFGIIMLYSVAGVITSDMSNRTLAALLDSFGIRAYSVVSQYYSVSDKNTLDPQFSGLLMKNRLIWLGVTVLVTLISYFSFSMKIMRSHSGEKKIKAKDVPTVSFKLPETLHPDFKGRTRWLQFKSIFSIDLGGMIRNPVFLILLIFSVVMMVINLTQGFAFFGLKTYPVTYHMTEVIQSSISLFTLIIIIFFSGELIWKSRISNFDQVESATPHDSITELAAHGASLLGLAVIFHLFFIVLAIFGQIFQGYFRIQLGVYLGSFLLHDFPLYAEYCCLFIFFQAVLSNRYLGYFLSIIVLFLLTLVLGALHIETNMLSYASAPSMPYSDMDGFGPGISGTIWFSIYWMLFGILLLFVAGLFIQRKITNGVKERWAQAKANLTRKYAINGVICLVLFLAVGAWVYYNTLVLNSYKTNKEAELLQVYYEKTYKHFEDFPFAKIVAADYDIQIYPQKRAFHAHSKITLKNENSVPIDSLLFTTDDSWNMKIKIPGARRIFDDKKVNFEIYRLAQPLMPGDSLVMEVQSNYDAKGFENDVSNSSVVENGTFVNNLDFLPKPGYYSDMELTDINKRKKYGLKPRKRAPDLSRGHGPATLKNYLSMGASDWIPVTTTISTSADQIAIAPGSLVKEWKENGRNYYHYVVDHPSQNFYSFQSARYKVDRKEWNGIKLEVYYTPAHSYNVGIMMKALQKSLDYYIHHFGPYYHKEARIIEFPRYASFAQSFPGTMPYSESIGFILDMRDTTKNNMVEAVVAHEMGHQWWAHQEVPAFMQGMTMLTESFAEYSSLMVLHQTRDDIKMREFLKYDYDRYLQGRGSESDKEVPLYKVENQQYIHYGKGSTILYALANYIGQDKMNRALSGFLDEFKYKNPPYPTSWDFIDQLESQTPDSLKYLIDDWLEKITFYDLRMTGATAQKVANGYEITMKVMAKKIYSDSLGQEINAPINDWIDLGLFSDKDDKKLIWVKRVKINAPEMTFKFTVNQLPKQAMIDPKRLYMERIVDDNNADVVLKGN